jgi:serine/threonine protein kinase
MNLNRPISYAGQVVRQVIDIDDLDVRGRGAFGDIFKGVYKESGGEVAVKVISKAVLVGMHVRKSQQIGKEINALKMLGEHNNIMKFYQMFEEIDSFELCLELIKGGDLFDRITKRPKYTEQDARQACKIILDAINHMHRCHVVHRDLKPENLMLRSPDDDFDILIVDFGLAETNVFSDRLMGTVGTPSYWAPEIMHGLRQGPAVDIWAFGVIVYLLLCGNLPFHDITRITREGSLQFPSPQWTNVSDESKNFIKSLLTMKSSQRPSATVALTHAWVRYICYRVSAV